MAGMTDYLNKYGNDSSSKRKKPRTSSNIFTIQKELERNQPDTGYDAYADQDNNGLPNYAEDFNNVKTQQSQSQSQSQQVREVNPQQFRTETASIEDIANKYGFNYSRDWAKTQAETERQAKQDGLNEAKQQVENNVVSSADGLDRDYFNQYMQQQQAQANSGLNGGIAADQNLRMSMNRQAEMGDIYRDANANQFQIDNELARLASEESARTEQLHNQRLQQLFENVMAEGRFDQRDNLAQLRSQLQLRGQDIKQDHFNRNMDFNRDKFDWTQEVDQTQLDQGQQRIDNQEKQYWNSFDNLSAAQQATNDLAEEKFDWSKEWKEHVFNNLSAAEQAANNRSNLNRALKRELANSGGSGGSGGSKLDWNDLSEWEKNQVENRYKNGTPAIRSNIEEQYPTAFPGSSSQPNVQEEQYSPENMTTEEKAYAISIQDLVKQEDLPLGELSEDEIIRFASKHKNNYDLNALVDYVSHLNNQVKKQREAELNESELSDRNAYLQNKETLDQTLDYLEKFRNSYGR